MEKLPNAQWRLLLALGRWGGMRVPSEPAMLRWEDIDFERQRITFRSPKTEHHEGRDKREIPIFPELVQPLREMEAMAPEGEPLVLPFLQRHTGTALRKPLLKAMALAQVKPWQKLWTAMRATRDTELRESFPSHVVDAWLGHDDTVAKKHYSQVLDSHYEAAIGAGNSFPVFQAHGVSSAETPCSQKCSHLTASMDPHGGASDTEIPENAAFHGTASHSEVIKWALQDLNLHALRHKILNFPSWIDWNSDGCLSRRIQHLSRFSFASERAKSPDKGNHFRSVPSSKRSVIVWDSPKAKHLRIFES